MSLLNENEKVLKEAYFVQKLNQFIIYFHLGHKKNEEMKGKTKLLLNIVSAECSYSMYSYIRCEDGVRRKAIFARYHNK